MNQDNTQENKVALVTGASRRVGAAIVQALHQAGFRVAIHCNTSLMEANTLAAALNTLSSDSACVFQCNLSQHNEIIALVKAVLKWSGQLDLLVNNASVFKRTDISNWDLADEKQLYTVNVFAPFALSTAAYPALAQHHGCIVNITDIHAHKALKGYSLYCQSKAALTMQTKSLAREFAPYVRVNAVAPGAIAWPEEGNSLSQTQKEQIIANTPLKSHGDPRFIAQAVVSLVQNPFITGQTLKVDGGRSIG